MLYLILYEGSPLVEVGTIRKSDVKKFHELDERGNCKRPTKCTPLSADDAPQVGCTYWVTCPTVYNERLFKAKIYAEYPDTPHGEALSSAAEIVVCEAVWGPESSSRSIDELATETVARLQRNNQESCSGLQETFNLVVDAMDTSEEHGNATPSTTGPRSWVSDLSSSRPSTNVAAPGSQTGAEIVDQGSNVGSRMTQQNIGSHEQEQPAGSFRDDSSPSVDPGRRPAPGSQTGAGIVAQASNVCSRMTQQNIGSHEQEQPAGSFRDDSSPSVNPVWTRPSPSIGNPIRFGDTCPTSNPRPGPSTSTPIVGTPRPPPAARRMLDVRRPLHPHGSGSGCDPMDTEDIHISPIASVRSIESGSSRERTTTEEALLLLALCRPDGSDTSPGSQFPSGGSNERSNPPVAMHVDSPVPADASDVSMRSVSSHSAESAASASGQNAARLASSLMPPPSVQPRVHSRRRQRHREPMSGSSRNAASGSSLSTTASLGSWRSSAGHAPASDASQSSLSSGSNSENEGTVRKTRNRWLSLARANAYGIDILDVSDVKIGCRYVKTWRIKLLKQLVADAKVTDNQVAAWLLSWAFSFVHMRQMLQDRGEVDITHPHMGDVYRIGVEIIGGTAFSAALSAANTRELCRRRSAAEASMLKKLPNPVSVSILSESDQSIAPGD